MPRIRTIKPDAFTSDSLSEVPRETRWTFAGLWTYADDKGRGRDDRRLIKAALYPLDDTVTLDDVTEDMERLTRIGAVCRYTAGGKAYFHMPGWEHQKINRPTPSKLPGCPTHEPSETTPDASVSTHGALTEGSPQERKGKEGSVGDDASASHRDDVERLCSHLADRIEGNGSKRPTITERWRDAARLMIDRDGHSEDDVLRAINWCQDDEFWRGNILSMPKLREKYDQLRLQALREQQRPSHLRAVGHVQEYTPDGLPIIDKSDDRR